jgi:hypothetical protein
MRSNLSSIAAAMAFAGGLPAGLSFLDSGPISLPPQKKKTGALKQRRASRKRKNRRRS